MNQSLLNKQVHLFLSTLGQPGNNGYLTAFLLDSTIAAHSILYFVSDQGRPRRWTVRQ